MPDRLNCIFKLVRERISKFKDRLIKIIQLEEWASQVVLVVKNLPDNAGDASNLGLISVSERCPGVGNGNPFHYSCLENSMDRGVWWAVVYGAAKIWA